MSQYLLIACVSAASCVSALAQIPDQVRCANAPLVVEADNTYDQYVFAPASAVRWSVNWRASLEPTETTEFTLRARRRLPRELLVNPSFTNGLSGYRTAVPVATGTAFPPDRIATVPRSGALTGDHSDCRDLGGGTADRFLAIHLDPGQRAAVVCQDVPVEAGQEYRFEFRIASLAAPTQTLFRLRIDGRERGNGVRSDPAACTWRSFGRDYLAERTGAVEICITAEAPADAAAKSALDQLSFRAYDEDLLDTFTVEVIAALPRRDSTVFVCNDGRFRLGDLDLGVGQIGDIVTERPNGCEEVFRIKVERAPGDTLTSRATLAGVCPGASVTIGDQTFAVARDTVVRERLRSAAGCDSVATTVVTVFDAGAAGLELSPPDCGVGNGRVGLAADAPAQLHWPDGGTERERGGFAAGDSVTFDIVSERGCRVDVATGFPAPGPPLSILGIDAPRCAGELGSVRLDLPTEGELRFLGSDDAAIATELALEPAVYNLVWRDRLGCDSVFSLTVPNVADPAYAIVGRGTVVLGLTPVFELVGPADVPRELYWRFDGAAVVVDEAVGLTLSSWSPPRDGILSAHYTDDLGCPIALSLPVAVQRAEDVLLPSAFSPDGDGLHDGLRLQRHPGLVRLSEAAVYDRWGGLQVARGAVAPGEIVWDGAGYGPGVYVLRAVAELRSGRSIGFTTEVTLVR